MKRRDPWERAFVWLPRKTISRRWVWGWCLRRVVWDYAPEFSDYYEFADLIDAMTGDG